MKVRKREMFDALQWFPGKKVPGVQGADPTKWCGCVFAGGPASIPHIHHPCQLVEKGDWVVTDQKGNRCLVKPDVFNDIYEKV